MREKFEEQPKRNHKDGRNGRRVAGDRIAGGSDLPIWFNSSRSIGFSADRALGAGMRNRPVRETARDLLTWWDSLPRRRTAKPRAGLSPMKEAEVLAAWKKRG